MSVETLGVIGAGTMGTGIAHIAAQAGVRVYLIDSSDEAIWRSRILLDESLQGGIDREKITLEEAEQIRRLISWAATYDCLAEADWVIEAVFEDLEVKREVLGRVSALAPEATPIATNTSTLPISELAEFCSRADCFLGMHFFNPAPAMKLVEVIPGERTLPAVTEAAVALCERMGKVPMICPDIPGFVVNRVFAAVVAAALDVWAAGAEPEVIDNAIELALGHKMGPLRTADLVGLDTMLAILRSLHAQTGHSRFEVPDRFVAMVESGKLGRKSGAGFYDYEEC